MALSLAACDKRSEAQPEQTQPPSQTVPTETQDRLEETTEPSTEPSTGLSVEPGTEPEPEADPLPLWEGKVQGKATTFYYDLDGDGTKEKYLFGSDFRNSLCLFLLFSCVFRECVITCI